MVLDTIGNYLRYADTRINPQSLFITEIGESSRFKFEGALAGINLITGIDEGIAFINGNSNGVLSFHTTSGYSLGKVNKNHMENMANGYMQDKNDFKNVEITFYVKLVNSLSNDRIKLKARTGKQIGSQNCEGCGIGFEFYYDGKCRAFKERRMGDSLTYGPLVDTIGDIENKWIGIKMCMFNTANDEHVKYELYLDTELSNAWKRYYQLVDDGSNATISGTGIICEGKEAQPITWGGPIIYLSWRNVADPNGIIFKNISIREIDINLPTVEVVVPKLFDQISIPTAPPADKFRYLLTDTWNESTIYPKATNRFTDPYQP